MNKRPDNFTGIVVDGDRYVCGACIRGHRVAKCKDISRPLRKTDTPGRPASGKAKGMRCDCSANCKCDPSTCQCGKDGRSCVCTVDMFIIKYFPGPTNNAPTFTTQDDGVFKITHGVVTDLKGKALAWDEALQRIEAKEREKWQGENGNWLNQNAEMSFPQDQPATPYVGNQMTAVPMQSTDNTHPAIRGFLQASAPVAACGHCSSKPSASTHDINMQQITPSTPFETGQPQVNPHSAASYNLQSPVQPTTPYNIQQHLQPDISYNAQQHLANNTNYGVQDHLSPTSPYEFSQYMQLDNSCCTSQNAQPTAYQISQAQKDLHSNGLFGLQDPCIPMDLDPNVFIDPQMTFTLPADHTLTQFDPSYPMMTHDDFSDFLNTSAAYNG